MKTITYNLIDEITDEAYINILRIIPSLNVNNIKNEDLVFYPINLDAIKEEKRFLISGNKIADKYLEDLDYAIERILEAYNIEVSREEFEKDEK
jgi:hypothetical protein